jgi:hypothetical protein
MKDLRWSPSQLVQELNDFAKYGLLYEQGQSSAAPPLLAKTVGKMGLKVSLLEAFHTYIVSHASVYFLLRAYLACTSLRNSLHISTMRILLLEHQIRLINGPGQRMHTMVIMPTQREVDHPEVDSGSRKEDLCMVEEVVKQEGASEGPVATDEDVVEGVVGLKVWVEEEEDQTVSRYISRLRSP